MLSHAPTKQTTITKATSVIALSIIAASLIALIILAPQFITMIIAVSSRPPSMAQPTPTASPALAQARAVIARLRAEIIPREGLATEYGVTFSGAGYQTLIRWNSDFQVELRYVDAFESLDLLLPCCEWHKPSRNEEQNCACAHHQAVEGLSKKLLSDGWDPRAVQGEVTRWTRFLFPVEALRAGMERRALLDPEIESALVDLKTRGEC